MADAADLKSAGVQAPCGFESRRRQPLGRGAFTEHQIVEAGDARQIRTGLRLEWRGEANSDQKDRESSDIARASLPTAAVQQIVAPRRRVTFVPGAGKYDRDALPSAPPNGIPV